jgi:hypothetical protein
MINDQYTTEDATQELLRISKWPEPLRLAYLLEKEMLWPLHGRAADELRRLHAIETKLAEQPAHVQGPVAWVDLLKQAEEVVRSKSLWKKYIDGTPLANDIAVWMASFAQEHTTPPAAQRQWVGLTDDDYVEMGISLSLPFWQYKAIEAKLKEKNNG